MIVINSISLLYCSHTRTQLTDRKSLNNVKTLLASLITNIRELQCRLPRINCARETQQITFTYSSQLALVFCKLNVYLCSFIKTD
jgi:hypothetical protein